MPRLFHSLQTKLTLSFIALVLIVTAGTFFYSVRESKRALLEITRAELRAVSAAVAAELSGPDGDALEALKAGDEKTAPFAALKDKLSRLRGSHPDFKYIYTMRLSGKALQFVVDPDYGNTSDPGAAIGEPYTPTPAILDGFKGPTADSEFTTDKWGTTMSGYAPIRNSRGQTVAVVGVDMSSDLVLQKQRYIGNTIYLIIGIGVLAAGLFIFAFSKTIIKDVNALNEVAQQISMGNTDVQMRVSRKDEIGDLAESFGRMVASLKIMMMQAGD